MPLHFLKVAITRFRIPFIPIQKLITMLYCIKVIGSDLIVYEKNYFKRHIVPISSIKVACSKPKGLTLMEMSCMGCALVAGLIGLGLDSQSSGSDSNRWFQCPNRTICNFGRYRDWNNAGSLCKSKSIGKPR